MVLTCHIDCFEFTVVFSPTRRPRLESPVYSVIFPIYSEKKPCPTHLPIAELELETRSPIPIFRNSNIYFHPEIQIELIILFIHMKIGSWTTNNQNSMITRKMRIIVRVVMYMKLLWGYKS